MTIDSGRWNSFAPFTPSFYTIEGLSFTGNSAYNLFVILQARRLWLGQSDRSWALGATPGGLPVPGPLPADYSLLKGTWMTSGGLPVISHSSNAAGDECNWEGTYEEWQAAGIWNPCDPSQPPGQVVAVGGEEPPPQAVAPAPAAPAPEPPAQFAPQPPPEVQPPQAGPGAIPVENPNAFNPPQLLMPVPVLVPGQAPAPVPAPKAAPPAPAASKSGTTTALVAGGLGIVGVAAALFFGGAFK